MGEGPAAPVVVRPVRRADVDGLVDLFAAVAAEGRWIAAEAPIDRVAQRERFEALVDATAAVGLVAEVDGRPVGFLGISLASYGVAELGMNVAADQRGRGVGTALLSAAIEWARAVGAHKVALQLWPHNVAARALYERCGFVEEGFLRRHYRRSDGSLWDAVVMGLVLDESAPGIPDFGD